MRHFTPCELASWCSGIWSDVSPDIKISGFCKDSRVIGKDDVYVALSGEQHDGHDFVEAAAAKGASCALVAEYYDGSHALPLLRVKDTCRAIQDAASAYRNKLDPFVVAVSGSSGKTTVKEMIASCLKASLRTSATRGNWNNHIGLPMSLLEMDSDTECAVMEVGMNHPGELLPLCRILRPDWSVITNVGPVHLEHFDSVEEIAREKAVLAANTDEAGLVFLDSDGEYYDILARSAHGEVITVSSGRDSDYSYVESTGDKFTIFERASSEKCDIRMTLPGSHIRFDAALAAAVARRRGVGWDAISAALSSYNPLPMRWEVTVIGGVTLINDAYNANPMSMRASITAFAGEPYKGKKCLVLGEMLELGDESAEQHRLLGEWLQGKGISFLVTVGDNARAVAESADGLCDAIIAVDTASEAAAALVDAVDAGDGVLFKGSRGLHLEEAVASFSESLDHN